MNNCRLDLTSADFMIAEFVHYIRIYSKVRLNTSYESKGRQACKDWYTVSSQFFPEWQTGVLFAKNFENAILHRLKLNMI
jgi:hypothetical protein